MNTLKTKGFILVTVLLLLSVVTFLSITSFDYAQMILKTADSYWKYEQQKIAFLKKLPDIEAKLEDRMTKIPCIVNPNFPNYYAEQSDAWLEAHACSLNNFYYVVEILSDKICAELMPHELYYLRIARITMVHIDTYTHNYLQSTYISKRGRAIYCENKSKIHELGRQGIRLG
jgi:hypothetical protein